jgi:4-amino-4-deoxychorismate lyase
MQFLETIRSLNAKLLHLEYHQKRVEYTLKNSTIKLSEILNPPKKGTYRCRIIYDEKEAKVTYHPYTLTLPQSFKLIHVDTLDYHLKYANRDLLNNLKERYPKYDEIIIVKNGLLTDTTIANIAFLDKRQWITPKSPLLKGTTRARLIKEGFLHVRDISVNDIHKYQDFALMNAMIDFQIIQNGIMSIKK